MRVIAGTYRSRLLEAPRGTATRPTSDRLRETLFNVLSARIAGAHFADLYAGSGAVGIEAISRGAAEVYFAETARPAVDSIRADRVLGRGRRHRRAAQAPYRKRCRTRRGVSRSAVRCGRRVRSDAHDAGGRCRALAECRCCCGTHAQGTA